MHQTEAEAKPILHVYELHHQCTPVVRLLWNFLRTQTEPSRGLEDEPDSVMRVARPLYRSYLSCMNAFPTPQEKEEWHAAVWGEACERAGVSLRLLPQDEGASVFICQTWRDLM